MNYWLEALEASLDENGCYESLRVDQRIAVAKDLERAAEMHGEATGTHNIPNPLSAELKNLERRLEEEKIRDYALDTTGICAYLLGSDSHNLSSYFQIPTTWALVAAAALLAVVFWLQDRRLEKWLKTATLSQMERYLDRQSMVSVVAAIAALSAMLVTFYFAAQIHQRTMQRQSPPAQQR